MIGRLIEHEQIWLLHEYARQGSACLLSAREVRDGFAEFIWGEPHSAQHGADARFDLISPLSGKRMQKIIVAAHDIRIVTCSHLRFQ